MTNTSALLRAKIRHRFEELRARNRMTQRLAGVRWKDQDRRTLSGFVVCQRPSIEATIVNSLQHLDHIDELAAELVGELMTGNPGSDAIWQVVGPPTAG